MKSITIKQDVLLVEITRYCFFPDCRGKLSIALTKADVPGYRGFECPRCERWNDDHLSQRDIPDWWDQFNSSGTFS